MRAAYGSAPRQQSPICAATVLLPSAGHAARSTGPRRRAPRRTRADSSTRTAVRTGRYARAVSDSAPKFRYIRAWLYDTVIARRGVTRRRRVDMSEQLDDPWSASGGSADRAREGNQECKTRRDEASFVPIASPALGVPVRCQSARRPARRSNLGSTSTGSSQHVPARVANQACITPSRSHRRLPAKF